MSASVQLSGVAWGQTKTFIDYLQPTPITCSALSSESWGVDGVLPRDLCNGIESAKGAGVPPDYYYWDGQILKAQDGKYHMFMSTWAGSAGFNPGWLNSDAYHAISDQGVLGPYQRQDFVYSNNGSHKGHNVSALELPDGSYAVIVSETVPFTIYTSASLDGPWTGCEASIQANGINYTDANFASNVSLVVRHDGKFEIVQRHGHIGIADSLCGPYMLQKPTWAYPSENLPSIDSIYPRRTSIPGVPNPTYDWEEDPHIWRSGGIYHVLYSGSGDRVGWHLYSPDGINDWQDGGLSCDPRLYDQIFCYEGSTTCNRWYKMERPGVVLEDGHVTHVTWAVSDVDKDNQIPGNSNHGSKVIVIPFDGVAFDNDYGVSDNGGAGGTGGSGRDGGDGAAAGDRSDAGVGTGAGDASAATGGTGGDQGSPAAGGAGGGDASGTPGGAAGQAPGVGGDRSGGAGVTTAASGGGSVGPGDTGAGAMSAGGPGGVASGGRATGAPTAGPMGSAGAGTGEPAGGSVSSTGSEASPTTANSSSSGCACALHRREPASGRGWFMLLPFALFARRRRRRPAAGRSVGVST